MDADAAACGVVIPAVGGGTVAGSSVAGGSGAGVGAAAVLR